MKIQGYRIWFLICGLITTLLVVLTHQEEKLSKPIAAVGNPDVLRLQYENWKQQTSIQQGIKGFTLTLVSPTLHSTTRTSPHGEVHFDLEANTLAAYVHGLSDTRALDLWVANGARLFTAAQNVASLRRIGR